MCGACIVRASEEAGRAVVGAAETKESSALAGSESA